MTERISNHKFSRRGFLIGGLALGMGVVSCFDKYPKYEDDFDPSFDSSKFAYRVAIQEPGEGVSVELFTNDQPQLESSPTSAHLKATNIVCRPLKPIQVTEAGVARRLLTKYDCLTPKSSYELVTDKQITITSQTR